MDLMARAVRPPQQKEGGRTTLDAISLLSQFKTNLNSGFCQVDADGDLFSGVDVGVVRLLEGPFQLLGINYLFCILNCHPVGGKEKEESLL